VGQIILLSRWFNKKTWRKNPIRKTNQKDLVKMAFWSSWTWGKKTIWGVFFIKIPSKKGHDFL
jgi:hypothetical protein